MSNQSQDNKNLLSCIGIDYCSKQANEWTRIAGTHYGTQQILLASRYYYKPFTVRNAIQLSFKELIVSWASEPSSYNVSNLRGS